MAKSETDNLKRKKLIAKISKASGVAQYALLKKMTDEEILKASEHLEIFELLKPSNNYNRYCQAQKTGEANRKLQEFIDPKHSEIVQAGKWLFNALSKTGSDRQQTLLEKDLVHKDDYNEAITDLKATITQQDDINGEMTIEAQQKFAYLEKRIDTLLLQQTQLKEYITNNYGHAMWQTIAATFDIEA